MLTGPPVDWCYEDECPVFICGSFHVLYVNDAGDEYVCRWEDRRSLPEGFYRPSPGYIRKDGRKLLF